MREMADELQGLPGLVRVAATSSWRTVRWAVGSTLRTGRDVVQRTLDGEPPAVVLQDTTAEFREFAWKALGLDEITARGKPEPQPARPSSASPAADGSPAGNGGAGGSSSGGGSGGGVTGGVTEAVSNVAGSLLGTLGAFGPSGSSRPSGGYRRPSQVDDMSTESLRARGEQLLRQSADVDVAEDGHPAYARILSELTPDEARILRFFFREGPQPAIDIRTNRPFGIGSELVAGGLSMIGEFAGLKHLDRIHPYMTNLFRLGLIEFSKETVRNPNRYQVIEAQPRMSEAMAKAGRAPKIVRRSIMLNDFGEEFCKTCLFDEQLILDATPKTEEH